jgi:hypothetical protein
LQESPPSSQLEPGFPKGEEYTKRAPNCGGLFGGKNVTKSYCYRPCHKRFLVLSLK